MSASPSLLRPLASLISKMHKAQLRLSPASGAYTRLTEYLWALRRSVSVLEMPPGEATLPLGEQARTLEALADLVRRTEQAQPAFTPGKPQHTLLSNRLLALRSAANAVANARVTL